MSSSEHKKIVFVIGATATGKSQVAIELARLTGGSIVNADSVQFYKDLTIGSAAPSEEDKKLVPHFLYSYIEAPTEFTAGEFVRDFYRLIENNKDLKFPLFVTGGTGFYIQALEKGMFNVPEIDPILKKQIEDDIAANGAEAYYQELLQFDPETKIHPNDHYRIGRAIEVKRQFGLKMTELASKLENKNALMYPYLKIGITFDNTSNNSENIISGKEEHRKQVEVRTQKMIEQGLIEETKNMLDRGYENWAPLNSVGYLETKQYLNGEITKEELLPLIIQSTMKLIKKQKTWFKRDPHVHWFSRQNLNMKLIENTVQNFLKS